MEILYITYIHIYMHCYQKLKQQFVPPKLKNKLTNKKKKYIEKPQTKIPKKHMTWNETKSNTMPRLLCSQSPTSPHTSPTKRVHSPTKLFLYTYRTVYLTQKTKTTLKLKTKPKPRCETQPKNNLNSKKRFKLNLISKKCKKIPKYGNQKTNNKTFLAMNKNCANET